MRSLKVFLTEHGMNNWHLLNYDSENYYFINNLNVTGVIPKKEICIMENERFQGSFNFEEIGFGSFHPKLNLRG